MIHMKMDKQDKDPAKPVEVGEEDYPYGLRIHLDENSIKKLGIKDLPDVKDGVGVKANAKVINSGTSSSEDGTKRYLELQITHMEMGPHEEEKKDGATQLYTSQKTETGKV